MESIGYLFAAYTIIWAVVFGYVFYLLRKEGKLRKEIDLLEKSLSNSQNDSAPQDSSRHQA
ncbi:CcmD family protein [Chloroflexota bacterium]